MADLQSKKHTHWACFIAFQIRKPNPQESRRKKARSTRNGQQIKFDRSIGRWIYKGKSNIAGKGNKYHELNAKSLKRMGNNLRTSSTKNMGAQMLPRTSPDIPKATFTLLSLPTIVLIILYIFQHFCLFEFFFHRLIIMLLSIYNEATKASLYKFLCLYSFFTLF